MDKIKMIMKEVDEKIKEILTELKKTIKDRDIFVDDVIQYIMNNNLRGEVYGNVYDTSIMRSDEVLVKQSSNDKENPPSVHVMKKFEEIDQVPEYDDFFYSTLEKIAQKIKQRNQDRPVFYANIYNQLHEEDDLDTITRAQINDWALISERLRPNKIEDGIYLP